MLLYSAAFGAMTQNPHSLLLRSIVVKVLEEAGTEPQNETIPSHRMPWFQWFLGFALPTTFWVTRGCLPQFLRCGGGGSYEASGQSSDGPKSKPGLASRSEPAHF